MQGWCAQVIMGSETGSMKSLEWSWHHQYYNINAILGEIRVTPWVRSAKPNPKHWNPWRFLSTAYKIGRAHGKRRIHTKNDNLPKISAWFKCTSFSAATHRSKTTKLTKSTKSEPFREGGRAGHMVGQMNLHFFPTSKFDPNPEDRSRNLENLCVTSS